MKEPMLDQGTLDDIVRRIAEVAQPEKIILFGSAARGDMNRHSDIDLLIVKEGVDTLDLMRQIRRNLHGVGAAVDPIVVTSQGRRTLQGQSRTDHQARAAGRKGHL